MSETRSHETIIEIDAPIEEVWKAITESREVERWLAPKAEVTPGVGGTFFVSWGPGMEGTGLIEVWEPNRHLRVIESRHAPARVVEDFYLESKDGKTVLRLVHSGFSTDAAWDGEFEGTKSGWPGMFRTMKHGIERHPGKPIRTIQVFHMVPGGDPETVLAKLMAVLDWRGTELVRTPTYYQGTIGALDDALGLVMVSGKGGSSSVYISLVVYGMSDERGDQIEAEWKAAVASVAP